MMMTNVFCFKNCDVKNVRTFEENGRWFLDVTFKYEDTHTKKEVRIPKIELDMSNAELKCETYGTGVYLDFYNNEFRVHKDSNGFYYTSTKTDKPEKLTLEDVEKRLGYKVELVAKKGD